MKSLYLILNLCTIAGPLALSFDKKVAFYKNWKYLFPAIFYMMLLFIPWDIGFTYFDVWHFNPDYVLGFYIFDLPIEEWLFFITVPYACVFIYTCLNIYFPHDYFKKRARLVTLVLFITAIALYVFNTAKLYTAYTAILTAFAMLIHLLFLSRNKYMGNFYRAFLVCLAPMFVIDGILTYKPIIIYNEIEKTPFRIGSIPWEDFLYNLLMLLMVVGFYEFLKRKPKPKAEKQIGNKR